MFGWLLTVEGRECLVVVVEDRNQDKRPRRLWNGNVEEAWALVEGRWGKEKYNGSTMVIKKENERQPEQW